MASIIQEWMQSGKSLAELFAYLEKPVDKVDKVEKPVDKVEKPVDKVEKPVDKVEKPVDKVGKPVNKAAANGLDADTIRSIVSEVVTSEMQKFNRYSAIDQPRTNSVEDILANIINPKGDS